MKTERWQKIEQVYHASLNRESNQRAAFLQEPCAGDKELLQEVESLLAYQPQAESFIEALAPQMAAQGLSADQARSLVGRQIGSFKVLSLIRAGGMGEVYRARGIVKLASTVHAHNQLAVGVSVCYACVTSCQTRKERVRKSRWLADRSRWRPARKRF
jgi:hypothetical protein